MTTETIDHATLSRLVQAGAVHGARVIGQAGGWALSIRYGMAERFLAGQLAESCGCSASWKPSWPTSKPTCIDPQFEQAA